MTVLDFVFGAIAFGLLLSAVSGVVALFAWSVWHTCRTGVEHLKQLHQVPCHRCQYFTGDYRLKCTVNPLQACTSEAIHCRDYDPSVPAQRAGSRPLWPAALGCAKDLGKSLRRDSDLFGSEPVAGSSGIANSTQQD